MYEVGLAVNIGGYTKAAEYNSLAGNADFLQELGDVCLDMDPTTGTGAMRGTYSAPVIIKVANSLYLAEWIDDTNAAQLVKRVKTGTTAINCKPSTITDCTYTIPFVTQSSNEPT